MSYRCPVCANADMPHSPRDYAICPCCGVEFGLDDVFESHSQLRDAWLKGGAHWSIAMGPWRPPVNWNGWDQLDRAGFPYTVERPSSPIETVVFHAGRPRLIACDDCYAGSLL